MKKNILVVGSTILTKQWFGFVKRISPESSVPLLNYTNTTTCFSAAAGIMQHFMQWQIESTLLTYLSLDNVDIIHNLNKYAIKFHSLGNTYKYAEQIKIFSNNNQQLLNIKLPSTLHDSQRISQKCLHKLDDIIYKNIEKSDIVIVYDDENLSIFHRKLILFKAQAQNKKIIVYINDFNKIRYYKQASFIILHKTIACNKQNNYDNNEVIINTISKQTTAEIFLIDKSILIWRHHQKIWRYTMNNIVDLNGIEENILATYALCVLKKLSYLQFEQNFTTLLTKTLYFPGSYIPSLHGFILHNNNNETTKFDIDILQQLNLHRDKGLKIVMTNGCFDVLHVGHVTCLLQAKARGDILVVALNTDESIKRLKGSKRPINDLSQRMQVLLSFNFIDYVIPFSEDTPLDLIKIVRPDVLVKGGDYKITEIVGADFVQSYGGEVKSIKHQKLAISSSQIIDKNYVTKK